MIISEDRGLPGNPPAHENSLIEDEHHSDIQQQPEEAPGQVTHCCSWGESVSRWLSEVSRHIIPSVAYAAGSRAELARRKQRLSGTGSLLQMNSRSSAIQYLQVQAPHQPAFIQGCSKTFQIARINLKQHCIGTLRHGHSYWTSQLVAQSAEADPGCARQHR